MRLSKNLLYEAKKKILTRKGEDWDDILFNFLSKDLKWMCLSFLSLKVKTDRRLSDVFYKPDANISDQQKEDFYSYTREKVCLDIKNMPTEPRKFRAWVGGIISDVYEDEFLPIILTYIQPEKKPKPPKSLGDEEAQKQNWDTSPDAVFEEEPGFTRGRKVMYYQDLIIDAKRCVPERADEIDKAHNNYQAARNFDIRIAFPKWKLEIKKWFFQYSPKAEWLYKELEANIPFYAQITRERPYIRKKLITNRLKVAKAFRKKFIVWIDNPVTALYLLVYFREEKLIQTLLDVRSFLETDLKSKHKDWYSTIKAYEKAKTNLKEHSIFLFAFSGGRPPAVAFNNLIFSLFREGIPFKTENNKIKWEYVIDFLYFFAVKREKHKYIEATFPIGNTEIIYGKEINRYFIEKVKVNECEKFKQKYTSVIKDRYRRHPLVLKK